MLAGQKRKKGEGELPSPERTSPAAHSSHRVATTTTTTTRGIATSPRMKGAAAVPTATVTQPRTPPPSSRGPLSRPSPSSPSAQGKRTQDIIDDGDDDDSFCFSDSDNDDDSDQEFDDNNDDNDDNNNSNPQDHKSHHHPPLHIPDIPWRPDLLLPPYGIFPASHFLTEENWELWHNNWLSILLANGVPTTTNSSSSSSSSSNRFLLSIRDDYLLGAYMRMTMTPEVLRGNPSCENQLVEFVSAKDLWRWLFVTLGDFSSGGGPIRIVRADQPWRIRGRTWTRFGRVVDVEALREGEGYDDRGRR